MTGISARRFITVAEGKPMFSSITVPDNFVFRDQILEADCDIHTPLPSV
jgi:hypothetical protein